MDTIKKYVIVQRVSAIIHMHMFAYSYANVVHVLEKSNDLVLITFIFKMTAQQYFFRTIHHHKNNLTYAIFCFHCT